MRQYDNYFNWTRVVDCENIAKLAKLYSEKLKKCIYLHLQVILALPKTVSKRVTKPTANMATKFVTKAVTKSVTAPVTPPDGGYGWVVVLAAFGCFSLIGTHFMAFSLLYKPTVEAFGSSYATAGFVGSISTACVHIPGEL